MPSRNPKKPIPESIENAPNLLYPRDMSRVESDTQFVKDIRLNTIVAEASKNFVPDYTDSWSQKVKQTLSETVLAVFTDGIWDLETANYRLAVFDYLQKRPDSREHLKNLFVAYQDYLHENEKGRYERRSHEHRNTVHTFLSFIKFVKNFDFNDPDAPPAIKRLCEHFSHLRYKSSYKKMSEIAQKLSGDFDVCFRVKCEYFISPRTAASVSFRRPKGGSQFGGEFDANFTSYSNDNRSAFETFLDRAVDNVYGRHIVNAKAQIDETFKMMPQLGFYLGILEYCEYVQNFKRIRFCLPNLHPRERCFASITDAKHPLIDHFKGGIVGNDITYDAERRIKLITGPTYGGKSVYDQVVGLVHALPMKGCPAFASGAEMSMRDGIYTHFEEPGDIVKSTSGFSADCSRTDKIFDAVTPFSLVIVDEPTGGICESDGMEASLDYLGKLSSIGCPAFWSTHIHPVADAVNSGVIPGAENWHFTFRKESGQILFPYKLLPGKCPPNYGMLLRDQYGLGEAALEDRLKARAQKEGWALRK